LLGKSDDIRIAVSGSIINNPQREDAYYKAGVMVADQADAMIAAKKDSN